MDTHNFEYDYESLPEEQRVKIAQLIARDNLQKVNSICVEAEVKHTFYTEYIKRFIDVIVSILAIIISLPINFIIAVITFFDVGSPILFKQVRIGKNHKFFNLVKFRNMRNETNGNGVLLRADRRVTKWGTFVRKTSLDELLNFVNILKGDMSLIGPRPLPIVYEGRFSKRHESRHKVLPGLDCPLQDPSEVMTWQNRLDNDVWYAEHVSFITDVKMIFLLIHKVFLGKDKRARAQGYSEGTFVGYFEDGRVMDSNNIPEKYYKAVLEERNKDNEVVIQVCHDTSKKREAIMLCDSAFTVSVIHRNNYEELFRKIDNNAEFIIAKFHNMPIGYAALYCNDCKDRQGYITLIGVSEAYQHKRIGTMLIEKCKEISRKNGMNFLKLEVLNCDIGPQKFYERMGFIRSDEKTDNDSSYMSAVL